MKVYVFDDSAESRLGFVELFQSEDLHVEPVENPGTDLVKMLQSFKDDNFVFSDYHLQKHPYTNFDGDVIISQAYLMNIPGMLCSSYDTLYSTLSRSIRRYIPVIVDPGEVEDPEIIYWCNNICIEEFKGNFSRKRKPWRALARVDEYDAKQETAYVIFPGWDSRMKIGVPLTDFSETLRGYVKNEGFRFYSKVNLGCENPRELYFTEVEYDS